MNDHIEKVAFPDSCYKPIIDFESWRVAVLRFCDDLIPEKIENMQKHLETDEVFVLISGSCNLYSAGTGDLPGEIIKVPMEMHKGYNVKKGVWHTHTLSEDAAVLIVENQDTSDDNSPIYPITEEMREVIKALEYEE